jgi:transcriptional regulator with XRE-family HTH domain
MAIVLRTAPFVNPKAILVDMTILRSSDHVAARIREVRHARGLSAGQLAERCEQLGAPQLTASVINNIETGRRHSDGSRRRDVTVDELLALALALNAPPLYLIFPPDNLDAMYPLTSTVQMEGRAVAAWFTGTGPILQTMASAGDTRRYYAERPVSG